MKTRIIQDEPAPAAGPPVPAEPRRRAGTSVLRIGLGSLALLIALALLVSGALALGAVSKRDAAGYYMTSAHRISTPSNALVSRRLDIETDAPEWTFGNRSATTRIEASSSRPVFVGIGPAAAVERYLSRVDHAVVTDVDTDPIRMTSHLVPGSASPTAPAAQGFWRVQSSGSGARTVTWPVESGRWSVVMMNADGAPGVDVQARFGARVPLVRWVAIGLLAGGAIALLIGALLLRPAITRRRSR